MASGTGRPRASSREVLAEAACELFLEKGFAATSVADITTRAGVSRSSFFNYFGSKGDILWSALDERIDALRAELTSSGEWDTGAEADAATAVRVALEHLGEGFAPDALALAIVHAEAMDLADELEREASIRRARIGAAVSRRLRAAGVAQMTAEVAGAAHGGAVLAAIDFWAHEGAGRAPLAASLHDALDVAALIVRVS